jgi:hypothetical protein
LLEGDRIGVLDACVNMALLENINPKLYRKCEEREITPEEEDDYIVDPFDSREVFGILIILRCGTLNRANLRIYWTGSDYH